MKDFNDFELYLIKRLDVIDDKISKLNIKIVKSASIFGALSGVITALFAFLIKINI